MSRLITNLANFTFSKFPQPRAEKVINPCRPNKGELLKLRDEGIPPGEGMFSVFLLNGVQVLVKYVEKLPYDHNLINLDGNCYKFVKPLPNPKEVKKGESYTMFVGSAHFLVQIVQVLSESATDSLNPAINQPGIGFAVIQNPTAGPPGVAPLPANAHTANNPVLQPITGTKAPAITTSKSPKSESFPLCPRKIKRVPVPGFLQIPFITDVTTTVDPLPKSKPPQNLANHPIPPADDVGSSRPLHQPHLPLSTVHRGQNGTEPFKVKPATGDTTNQGETGSKSDLQWPHLSSAPLGTSLLRNEVKTVLPDSPPKPGAEVGSSANKPMKTEGLTLRDFPSPLTYSFLEELPDEYIAQREAIVVMKVASHLNPSVRTGCSLGTKLSNRSRSRSRLAVPSTRTPNPRPSLPLPDQQFASPISNSGFQGE